MRIIAGEFRSRRLLTPRDAEKTRPIPDRVKESLFGLLRGNVEGAAVFDAFAGTGAIGLEAVSRGAAHCVMVERERDIGEILRKNVEALGAQDRCEVVIGDALGAGALARCPRPVGLVFFDPPYPLVRDPLGWRRLSAQFRQCIDLLTDDGFAILRTPWPFEHEIEQPGGGAEAPPISEPRGVPAAGVPGPGRHTSGRAKGRKERPAGKRFRWEGELCEDITERVRRGENVQETEPPGEVEVKQADAAPAPGVPVDLAFPNAVGPETHVYHAMAVHLYMRKK